MKNNLLHKPSALRVSFILLLLAAGMTKAFAYYDFSQTCATGQTLYYTITDATNHYVEISCPGDPDDVDCWTGFAQPTGDITLPSSVTYGGTTYTVTSIGESAFYDCFGMTGSLTIPNSVTTIGAYAFDGCSGFTGSLTIPNSVTTIGAYAFDGCSGFTGSLTIPNSVTTIGNNAFNYCSGFTGSMTLGNSVTTIGLYAFDGCSGFTGSLIIPNSVTTIGTAAFRNCIGFTGSLTIPNSVTTIENNAFAYCNGFTGSLTIPNSVTTIGQGAFWLCSGFTGSLTLGNSLTTIGESVFEGCSGFTAINSLAVAPPTASDDAFSGVNPAIPVTVPCGSLGAYQGTSGWIMFTNWMEACSYTITATADPTEGGTISGAGTYNGGETCTLTATPSTDYIFVNWTKDGSEVSTDATYTFTVTGNATYVAHFEFVDPDPLTYAINSDGVSVTVTGHKDGTAATGPITIPETKTIGGVTYTVTAIGDAAFFDCNGFTGSLTIPNTVTEIGDYAFYECSGLTGSLTIPNSVTTIGMSVFERCSGLTGSLTIPNSVTTIGTWAFNECSGFTGSLTLSNSLTTIGSFVFYYCSGFTGSLVIPNSVTTIEECAFEGCSSFDGSLTLPNSVTTIGNQGFAYCDGFAAINSLAVAPSSLGSSVFYAVNPAIPVTVPCGSLGDYQAASGWSTFTNWIEPCSHEITATANPAAGGTVSGGGTYTGGQNCTLTATPSTGYNFINWTKDGVVVSTSATYTFTVTSDATYVALFELGDFDPLTYAINSDGVSVTVTGHVDGTAATGSITIPETKTLGGVTYTVTAIGGAAFKNCSGLTGSLTIPNTVTTIGNNAFAYCSGFTGSLTLGNSLTTVGYAAFYACGSFTGSLTIPNSVTEIGEFAFGACSGFTGSLTLGNSLTAIGSSAFYGCNGFTGNLTIPNSVTTIEGYAFGGCSGFDGTLTLSNSVTTIGESAFYECSGLTGSLTIPNSVTTIGYAAFYACGGLTGSLTIPNSVTTIGNNAFAHCTGFTGDLTLGNSVIEVGNYAFYYNTGLTAINSLAVAPPALGVEAFYGVSVSIPVTVPCGSLGTYQAASGWDVFTNWIEPCSHEITAVANPSAGGTITGAGTYDHGASCTLTATPNAGYLFVNWTKGGSAVSTSATYTFTVTEAGNYVANFIEPSGAQTSNFTSGWNWWNTYIGQESIDGLAQLEACLGSNGIQIKSQQQYVNYYEGMGWMGMLSSINNESTYKIKTSAPCVVEMIGEETTSAAHPITIGPGWNWIGYPVNASMSITDALSGIEPSNGDQLKAQNGYANYYEGMGWMGTLSTITPSMGLLYKSYGSGAFTLVYPTGTKGETLVENITSENNYWVPDMHAYPDNMTVTAVVELDDNELQSDHYELAAFANGECRGSVRLMYVAPIDRHIAFLTITGEDVETLTFSLYDTQTGEEIYDAQETLNFSNNATMGDVREPYAIRFRGTVGLDEWAGKLQVFPNPVARGENINLSLSADEIGEAQVEIINALGQVETIRTTSLQTTIAAPSVTGVYTLRITVEGKGTCYRKLVVR